MKKKYFTYLAASLVIEVVMVFAAFSTGFLVRDIVVPGDDPLPLLNQAFSIRSRRLGVNTPGNIMQSGGMAARTSKILAVHSHVNIQGFARFGQ